MEPKWDFEFAQVIGARLSRVALIFVAILVLLVVQGCGGSDPEPESPPVGPPHCSDQPDKCVG